jgi:hypothetical protein
MQLTPSKSLAYHYIRSLIYRPAVVANLGDKGSSAMVAVGDSCKHIVQIVELLDERKLSLSFCLNRNEILIQAGFGLLFQTLSLDRDGKLIKDCNRLTCVVMDMLDSGTAAGAQEYRRVGCSMIAVPRLEHMPPTPVLSRHNSEGMMCAPMDRFRATQKSLKAIAARFSPSALKASPPDTKPQEPRRATLPAISPSMGVHTNTSLTSLSSIRSEPANARSEPNLSPLSHRSSLSVHSKRRASNVIRQNPNIDYLSFGPDPLANYALHQNPATTGAGKEVSPQDWERLLSSLDNGQQNIYDTIYGGPPADALLDCAPLSAGAESTSNLTWSPNMWNWNTYSNQAPPPQSVLSFSDESLTSGEEFAHSAAEYGSTPGSERVYQGIIIPDLSQAQGMGLGGLDGNFGL